MRNRRKLALLVLGLLVIKGLALAAIAPTLEVAARERWLFAALLAQAGEFAFVVFGVARSAHVLPGDWDALLTAAVALSMAATPLLLLAHDALLARQARAERAADTIDDDTAPVIVAGAGRYGQIIARLLSVHGIKVTVLDHDPDQIDLLSKFGFKVFYGDATRLDLLHAAGAAKARLLVVAIDDVEDSLRLVDAVRSEFPIPADRRARTQRAALVGAGRPRSDAGRARDLRVSVALGASGPRGDRPVALRGARDRGPVPSRQPRHAGRDAAALPGRSEDGGDREKRARGTRRKPAA